MDMQFFPARSFLILIVLARLYLVLLRLISSQQRNLPLLFLLLLLLLPLLPLFLLALIIVLQFERVDASSHVLLRPFHRRAVKTKVPETTTDVWVWGGGFPGEFLTRERGKFVGQGGFVGQRRPSFVHGGRVGREFGGGHVQRGNRHFRLYSLWLL